MCGPRPVAARTERSVTNLFLERASQNRRTHAPGGRRPASARRAQKKPEAEPRQTVKCTISQTRVSSLYDEGAGIEYLAMPLLANIGLIRTDFKRRGMRRVSSAVSADDDKQLRVCGSPFAVSNLHAYQNSASSRPPSRAVGPAGAASSGGSPLSSSPPGPSPAGPTAGR